MLIDYARRGSLRVTAERFGVGYRSLQRHLEVCIFQIMIEEEEDDFNQAFAEANIYLRKYFAPKPPPPKPRVRKSIIKKEVKFTWSRRSWSGK